MAESEEKNKRDRKGVWRGDEEGEKRPGIWKSLTENSLLHIVLSLLFSAVLYVPTLFFTQKKLILAIFH